MRHRDSLGAQRDGTGQLPTWVDWAGGDTFWGVGATGAAVYVGGHPRWMNNPYRSNAAGPGAVPREGIAGLDPINGLPFTWNPGRARGVGTFDIVGTPDGLFVGSDTDQFGGETRRKIAFFPLTGGTVVPPNIPYGLPNDLYRIDEATSSFTPPCVRWNDARAPDHTQHRRELVHGTRRVRPGRADLHGPEQRDLDPAELRRNDRRRVEHDQPVRARRSRPEAHS